MSNEKVTCHGQVMNYRTAIAVVGNGGGTRIPASSRASRFFGYVSKHVSLNPECPQRCDSLIEVGKKGNFHCYGRTSKKTVVVKDTPIRFISYRKNLQGLNYPVHRWCRHISDSCTVWVYSDSDQTFLRCKIGKIPGKKRKKKQENCRRKRGKQ